MLEFFRKRLVAAPVGIFLAALQVWMPLSASAQPVTVTITQDQWKNKLEKDSRLRNNAAGARKNNAPATPPDLRYNTEAPAVPVRIGPTADEAAMDAQRAQAAADKYFRTEDSQTLNEAQRGRQLAGDAFFGANVRGFAENPGISTSRRSGSTNQIGADELFPGFGGAEGQRILATFGATYDNPELIKSNAEYNVRNRLKRNGCQRTDFEIVEKLNPAAAFTDRAHRILSITFFDYTRVSDPALPGQTESCIRNGQAATCPAQDKERFTFTPSVYRGEPLKLSVALFGAEPGDWTDFVSDTRAIQYDHNPFAFPAERQAYFPYNLKLLYRVGGATYEAPAGSIVSYGSPSDRWTPTIVFTPPLGTEQIVLVADAYKAVHHFIDPQVYGWTCPVVPPPSCTLTADNGQSITWCPGTPGANIISMFSSTAFPDAALAQRDAVNPMYNNVSNNQALFDDNQIKLGAFKGLNAGSSTAAQSLSASCYRVPASRVNKSLNRKVPENINVCSRAVLSAFEPNGCSNMQRAFGITSVGQHVFLTVRAWRKRTVTIPPPVGSPPGTPSTTVCQKEAINVTGDVNLQNFPVFGGDRSTNPEPEGCDVTWLEQIHTPFGGNPKEYAVAGASANGGTVSVSHFGVPDQNWAMQGTATGGGLSQMTVAANVYMVTVNEIAGCPLYLKMLRDNLCKRPTLTCTNAPSTMTISGVTFGEGLPTSGIVDLLAPWVATRANAVDYEEPAEPTGGGDPTTEIVNDNYGMPRMCWAASGGPLLECNQPDPRDQITYESVEGGTIKYGSDCGYKTADDGTPLSQCVRVPSLDMCSDDRRIGVFSAVCYNQNYAYNCLKEDENPGNANVESDVYVEVCNGGMRCLGTQCHRPNLSGQHDASFAEAAGYMESINHIKYDMSCAETDEPPTDVDQQCTLQVFKGKQLFCSYAVNLGKGATTATLVDGDCCKEALKQAGAAPTWIKYFQVYYLGKKLAETGQLAKMANAVGLGDAYNTVDKFFGEISSTIKGTFSSAINEASSFISENITKPVSSALDGFFGSAGSGAGATPLTTGVDAAEKVTQAQSWFGSIGNQIAQFKQMLMDQFHSFVKSISSELAGTMFTTEGGVVKLSPAFEAAMTYWMIARFIVSIVFACKKEEYEWGMQQRWRLCAFAGTCCSKKASLVGCLQERKLYCCYKSIVARVIATEIITKGLIPGRNGYNRRKCMVNCSGFTVEELAHVDWSRIDMTEAIDAMIDSGIINPNNPQARYGVIENRMSQATVVGGSAIPELSDRVAADKTSDSILNNANSIIGYGSAISGARQCYDDSNPNKMPFKMEDCPSD